MIIVSGRKNREDAVAGVTAVVSARGSRVSRKMYLDGWQLKPQAGRR